MIFFFYIFLCCGLNSLKAMESLQPHLEKRTTIFEASLQISPFASPHSEQQFSFEVLAEKEIEALYQRALDPQKTPQQRFIDLCITAERGHVPSLYHVGRIYENESQIFLNLSKSEARHRAFILYEMASKEMYVPAFHALGKCYELGRGCQKNIEKAVEIYRMASEKGSAESAQRLGFIFSSGSSGDYAIDNHEAFAFYKRARDLGASIPEKIFQDIFFNGKKEYQENPIKLKNWYSLTSSVTAEADFEQGKMYEEGVLVKKNTREAKKYYLKASERGHVKAEEMYQKLAQKSCRIL